MNCTLLPFDGIWNPCLPNNRIPERVLNHEVVQSAWQGLDPSLILDCHTHILGVGDNGTGAWVHPSMQSLMHPLQYAKMRFFMNAGCAGVKGKVDQTYIKRLLSLLNDFPKGARIMLLAFDYRYSESGERLRDSSSFSIPNSYANRLARDHPEYVEWAASIHPYRRDCLEELDKAVAGGARAIKWLPQAMGIDPASPLCDPFYEAMANYSLPLLTHAGDEEAVHGSSPQSYGNPLLLRRALDHGIRVIVAHCASLGYGRDLDKGENGPLIHNFELFTRLMETPRYEGVVYGDISSITQNNRMDSCMDTLIRRAEWHPRLLYGSDYPLPGVLPLFSMRLLKKKGYITAVEGALLSEIRRYNPLLFDFVLKRTVRIGGKGFSDEIFQAGSFFRSQLATRNS